MDNFKFFGGRVGAFCVLLGIFILFHFAHAHENETEPTANVNLGPIQKWRSAYFCLKHKATTGNCTGWGANKGILTPGGNLSVSQQDLGVYCSPQNCADQIRFIVLKCISLVHNEFVFVNKAKIDYVNNTIAARCATQDRDLIIDGVPKSSGKRFNQRMYVSVVSTLLVFLAVFNMREIFQL